MADADRKNIGFWSTIAKKVWKWFWRQKFTIFKSAKFKWQKDFTTFRYLFWIGLRQKFEALRKVICDGYIFPNEPLTPE